MRVPGAGPLAGTSSRLLAGPTYRIAERTGRHPPCRRVNDRGRPLPEWPGPAAEPAALILRWPPRRDSFSGGWMRPGADHCPPRLRLTIHVSATRCSEAVSGRRCKGVRAAEGHCLALMANLLVAPRGFAASMPTLCFRWPMRSPCRGGADLPVFLPSTDLSADRRQVPDDC